jgi:hypothetical protein
MLGRLSPAFVIFALASLGCSDAVEPPPQGSLIINVTSSPDAPPGTSCPSIGHTKNIGVPPPSANNPGQRVVDGEGGNVACTVKGGDPAKFNGKINQGNISFTMIGETGATGTGNIIYYDNEIALTMQSPSDNPCIITAEKTGTGYQVEAGRIWAEFSCPLMTKENYSCKASGIFVMENCGE